MIQNPEHYESVSYRWTDLTASQLEQLRASLGGLLDSRYGQTHGFVAWVELSSTEAAGAVRRTADIVLPGSSRGVYVSLTSELWGDSVSLAPFVRDLVVDIGGSVDFSFTGGLLESSPSMLSQRPMLREPGAYYDLTLQGLNSTQLHSLQQGLGSVPSRIASRRSGGATDIVIQLVDEAGCVRVLQNLERFEVSFPSALTVALITFRDNDGISVEPFVVEACRGLRCDLEFSFAILDEDEAEQSGHP